MTGHRAWICSLAALGLLLVAACGGSGAGATKPSPLHLPMTESGPPAFQGEPDYQKVPITGAKDAGVSDQDARDLLRLSVRFANYLWTFNEGQTGGRERQKVWRFYTPPMQTSHPLPSDQEARRVGGSWRRQPGRQWLTWFSPPLSATLLKSEHYPGDVEITVSHAQTIAPDVHGPEPNDTAVNLEVQKIAGHWRIDTYSADGSRGGLRLDE